MKKYEKELKSILDNDPLNLLDVKPKASNIISTDERLINSFEEINTFFKENDRAPERGKDIEEMKLCSRLKGIRENIDKVEALKRYDKFNLLEGIEGKGLKEVKTIKDILEDDPLGLLDKESDDIFDLKYIPKNKKMPDYIASRKSCDRFDQFEHLFKECHLALSAGRRKLRPFKKEQQISKGDFFILKGIMVYVSEVGAKERLKNKTNARLRCIFENGTESRMLLRSLSAELYKDGRRVTEGDNKANNELIRKFNNISNEDEGSGIIYIAKSQSDKKEIREIKNLYKIGYSTIPVEDRVRNAENDPTYLMSKVSVVAEFECYNMATQKLELLLHKFFSKSCLDIVIEDSQGKRHTPREWFVVPFPAIEEAIHLLMSGEIVQHRYDVKTQLIVRKS